MDCIELTVNGRRVTESRVPPTTTLLAYLRENLQLAGTKEGCAEGDCGACTVAVLDPEAHGGPRWRAVNACLVLLPMMHGREVVTVEGLRTAQTDHPVQTALVDALGSQCGYCTPGVVMSMFEACYREDLDAGPDTAWKRDDQLCGNLCRCTGYRPIREATQRISGLRPDDRFRAALAAPARPERSLSYAAEGQVFELPTSLDALFEARARHPSAELVHGGTDLSLRITKRFERIPALISLEAVPELTALELDEAAVCIGAGVDLATLEAVSEAALPALARMLRFFAARQIKNRGTVGGNLCTASPIGDLAPALIAHRAIAIAAGPAGRREVPLDAFFTGYRRTALAPEEILLAVRIPRPGPDTRVASYKVSKRQELDISTVSAGLSVRLDAASRVVEAIFAFGGMAATPARARAAEAAVVGRPWTPDEAEATAERAAALIGEDLRPIDDHRGSAWYRATVAKNLLVGFALETAGGPAPALPHRPTATVVAPSEEAQA